MRNKAFRPRAWDTLEERVVPSGGYASVVPLQRLDDLAVQRHADALALVNAGEASNIVFFGDSITAFWGNSNGSGSAIWNQSIAPLGAADFGVESDRTQNLLWRLQNGELGGQPKVAVVMIGINNLFNPAGNASPDETAAGITSVVQTIRSLSPQTKVLLLGVLPSSNGDNSYPQLIQPVNSQVASLQDGSRVFYRDFDPLFIRPDVFVPTSLILGVHPTSTGYQILTDAIQAPLHEILGQPNPDPATYGGPILVNPPTDRVAEAADDRGALLGYSLPQAYDGLDPSPSIVSDPPLGAIVPIGTNLVTITATDRYGHTAVATFHLTVVAASLPVLHDVPSDLVVEATGPLGAVVNFAPPTATDEADPYVTILCSPRSGSTFPLGTTTVTCTATDQIGEVSTQTFNVTVRDHTGPTVAPIADLVVEATGPAGASATFPRPVVGDLVDPNPVILFSPPGGSTFPLGTTVVICSVTDMTGNITTTSFRVNVRDTPVLHDPPPPLLAEATSSVGAVVVFTPPRATDVADPGIRVTTSMASGSTFPLGTSVVTFYAKGVTGVITSMTTTITVVPREIVTSVPALIQGAFSQATTPARGNRAARVRPSKKVATLNYNPGSSQHNVTGADAVAFLGVVDANHNFLVTRNEMKAYISSIVDADHDGKISRYEQTLFQRDNPHGGRFLFPGS